MKRATSVLALLLWMMTSPQAVACSDHEYESCYTICLIPKLGGGCAQEAKDCKCLPKAPDPGGVGEESKRAINNVARELRKTPEAIQQCLARVDKCATEIISAPIAIAAQAYIEGLYRQSEGRSRNFSSGWVALTQPHFDIDVRAVTYAENINTGHGMTLAYCDRIFFTKTGDPWRDKNELFHTLHEMEHLVQCQKRGRRTFLAEYLLKGLVDMGKHGTFNVHDLHDFERAADAKATRLTPILWKQIEEAKAAGRYGSGSPQPNNPQQCGAGEVFMNTGGGACCTPNYSRCRNLTTGVVTCGMTGC